VLDRVSVIHLLLQIVHSFLPSLLNILVFRPSLGSLYTMLRFGCSLPEHFFFVVVIVVVAAIFSSL
jgi:hypothetical protein